MNVPVDPPAATPAGAAADTSTHAIVSVSRLSRLTTCSVTLSLLGLLVIIGLFLAVCVFDWDPVDEQQLQGAFIVLLSLLVLFTTGALLAVVSLFRRRLAWRSATLAFGVSLVGLAALSAVGYMFLVMLAVAAVEAAHGVLGGLMELLTLISGR